MNEITYCGIKFYTDCSYFKFTEGSRPSIITDENKSTVEITYPKNCSSLELSKILGLELIDDSRKLTPTNRFIKYNQITLTLNGLEFRKVTYEPHIVRMILVDDHESRVAQTYDYTTIVINTKDANDPGFKSYLFSNLKYLRLSKRKFDLNSYKIYDFPKIRLDNKSLNLKSEVDHIFKLRDSYDVYLIKAIDYEHEFFSRLRKILGDYGLELARINREETLKNTSYVSYSINQTPVKYLHVRSRDYHDSVMCHKLAIDFQLRTPDMVIYFDFKNRYNNVDLLTNFTEFLVPDKYGEMWTAAIKWGYLDENFEQRYGTDDNSNFSHQCNFRCELYFYEVYDKQYNYINDIIVELSHEGLYNVEVTDDKVDVISM